DELVLWTAGATVGAIPYEDVCLNHTYCTPNKLWEYPNARVPILVSPLIEMSKVINTYGVGWFLPSNLDPKAIAETVNRLTDGKIEEAAVACDRYMEMDGWPIYAQRLIAFYESLAPLPACASIRAQQSPGASKSNGSLAVPAASE